MNIGLTGNFASGKGEVARILQELGFHYCSLSDVIRKELRKEKKSTSRDNMIIKGNLLRERYGPRALAIKIKDSLYADNNIIDSIRNPFEVKELRKLENFHLIGIDAPIEIRFMRLKKRARKGDVKTLEELKNAEELENKNVYTNQQLNKTLSMADELIMNNESKKELKAKILKVIENWKNNKINSET